MGLRLLQTKTIFQKIHKESQIKSGEHLKELEALGVTQAALQLQAFFRETREGASEASRGAFRATRPQETLR